jgi:hypothetical protein
VTKDSAAHLPIFFTVQFNLFLYDGWKNEMGIDLQLPLAPHGRRFIHLLLSAGSLGEAGVGVGLGVDALFGTEGLLDFDAIVTSVQDIFNHS